MLLGWGLIGFLIGVAIEIILAPTLHEEDDHSED